MSFAAISVVSAKKPSPVTRQKAARAALSVRAYWPRLKNTTRRGRRCRRSSRPTASSCTISAIDRGPISTRAVANVDETVSSSVVSSPRGTGIARSSPTKSIAASR
jgi:hypothetical protein